MIKVAVLGRKEYTYYKGTNEKTESIAETAWGLLWGLVKRGEKEINRDREGPTIKSQEYVSKELKIFFCFLLKAMGRYEAFQILWEYFHYKESLWSNVDNLEPIV